MREDRIRRNVIVRVLGEFKFTSAAIMQETHLSLKNGFGKTFGVGPQPNLNTSHKLLSQSSKWC